MFENIKSSCKYVCENAKHVNINYNALDKFIDKINCSDLKHWLSSNPYNLLELGIEKIINLFLIYESIDYSFWGNPKWSIETDEGLKDGADALLYIMIKYVRENNTTDFSKLTYDEFSNLLKGNVEIPLIKERYNTIMDICNIVNSKMNGNFYKFIYDVKTDIELMNIIVNNFNQYKDERIYNGKTIYFYKLAQLLTSDILHLRETLENINVDYSHLIGCADYKIPQTLRTIGIIEYDEELSNIVDNKKEIVMSSDFEVEIRASQLIVIDYIREKINNVNSIDINDFLFVYSKKVKDIVKPYHLCRNTNY